MKQAFFTALATLAVLSNPADAVSFYHWPRTDQNAIDSGNWACEHTYGPYDETWNRHQVQQIFSFEIIDEERMRMIEEGTWDYYEVGGIDSRMMEEKINMTQAM